LSAQKTWAPLFVVAFALAGYAALDYLAAPRTGHVLDFKVTETSNGAYGLFVGAEVAPEAGTNDDFAATAIAIASVVPADTVTVSVERNDVASAIDRWRRTLARVQFRRKDEKPWSVITLEPLLSAKEIAASAEYSARAGLALDGSELLSPQADGALAEAIAAKHGLTADRVTAFGVPFTETGNRADWSTLPGPGSQHVSDLASCYSGKSRGSDGWKDCK
jgi:hypothetical protein